MRVLVTLGTIALGAIALTTALVLGATVSRAVDDGFRVEVANVDVVIHSDVPTMDAATGSAGKPSKGIDRASLERVATLPGTRAIGTFTRTTAVARAGDSRLGVALESLNTNSQLRWQGWSKGRAPTTSAEIALSSSTLDALKIRDGDWVLVGLPSVGNAAYRVVGVIDTRGSTDREDSAYGIVTSDVAEKFAKISGPNTLDVQAKPGADIAALVDDINRTAPVGLPVRTSEMLSANRDIKGSAVRDLSFLVAALAGVSCLVAGITSATTTGASLASRRRTWALLRCVGGSKRQVSLLVATEAFVLGLTAAVIGVGVGLALAWAAMPAFGLIPGLPELSRSAYTVHAVAVILPIALAVVLALLGSLVPAWLAARIPPSAALKPTESGPVRPSLVGAAVAALVLLGGGVLAFYGAGKPNGPVVGVGALLFVCGAGALLTPTLTWFARWSAGRARSAPIKLAFLDVIRRPRSAVIEAVAVSLAVAMITLSWVALASIQQSTSARLSESPMPDLVVGTSSGAAPISTEATAALKRVDGISNAVFVRFGRDIEITGMGTTGEVHYAVGTAEGNASEMARVLPDRLPLTTLRDDTVYLPTTSYPPFFPTSKVQLAGPDGTVRSMSVRYIPGLQVPSLISEPTMARTSRTTDVRLGWLSLKPGVDRAKVVDRITAIALTDGEQQVVGPTILDIRAANSLAAARAAAMAILSIAVLVAVIGAAATAALSISERARAHATLRALGLSRRNLGKLLATRVVYIGVMASVHGVLVGGFLGVVVSRIVVGRLGLGLEVAAPFLPILAVVATSVLAVRTAALIPMERASYVPPSQALSQG